MNTNRKLINLASFIKASIFTPVFSTELAKTSENLLRHKLPVEGPDIAILKSFSEIMQLIRTGRARGIKMGDLADLKNEYYSKKKEEKVAKGKLTGESILREIETNQAESVDYNEVIRLENLIGVPLHNGFIGYLNGFFLVDEDSYKMALLSYHKTLNEEMYTEEKDGVKTGKIRRFGYTYSFSL